MRSDSTQTESTLLPTNRHDYDPVTGSYHATHDWQESDSALITLIEVLSEATGQKQEEMEPLHSVIDLDALAAILTNDHESDVQVSFHYQDCTITISSSGEIVVQPTVLQ